MGNQILYERLYNSIESRIVKEGVELLADKQNNFGQTPRDLLGRTLARQHQKERDRERDENREVLGLGFFAFHYAMQEKRLSERIEHQAHSLFEVFQHRRSLLKN